MLRIRTTAGEETLDLAEFERRVLAGEIPPETPVRFPVITGDRFVPARELEMFRGLYRPDRIYFTRYFNLSRFPWITTAVVAANVAVYLAMVVTMHAEVGQGDITGWMVRFGAKATPLIRDLGQSWRFLTANFVHKDLLHIGFNLFVLFNIGGALENAFRPLDYLAILLASALGTTLVSFLGTDAISAGSSGIVFGCLGGAVAFGFKYRDIIPPRYRRFFGGSVMPYVLVFLWIGWMSTGIDNWGHLGGLLGGTAMTLLLRPRLLDHRGDRPRYRAWEALALAGVVAGVVGAGPVWSHTVTALGHETDDAMGLELAYPTDWHRAITDLGQLGFSNGLPEPTSLQVFSERRKAPVDLARLADAWFDTQLDSLEHVGRVRRVRREPGAVLEIAGRRGRSFHAAFETTGTGGRGVGYVLHLVVFSRGEEAYTVVLLSPRRRYAAYRPLFRRILRGIRLREPRFLRQARAATLLWPQDPSTRLALGDALLRLGDPAGAEAAWREAAKLAPADPAPLLRLGHLLLGEPRRRGEGRALVEHLVTRRPEAAAPRELLADYRLEVGDVAGALTALKAAAERDPGDGRLAERIRDLEDGDPAAKADDP